MASTENMEKPEKERQATMFQGKNIHASPVDGKLLCSFSEKTCMQRRLNHYAFCIRHVLEDKSAPFKQCKFVAKYNGQRCTNAIPVKEERIYCNSHLQVLGIVPKKSRKKKNTDQNEKTSHPISKTTEITSCRSSQISVVRRTDRVAGFAGTSKHDEKSSRKAKVLSANPVLLELVDTYTQASSHRQDLLSYYGLCSSDEESDEDSDHCKLEETRRKSYSVRSSPESPESPKCSPRAAKLQRLRNSLRAEILGVKKSINAHNKDIKQSNKALGLLMTSAKANPALTAVAIHNESKTSLSGSRKRCFPTKLNTIPCTAQSQGKIKCQRTAIPYTKYCSQHIINDSNQLLFHKCSADVSANSKCSIPTLDLLYEKPLCRGHALTKAFHSVSLPVQNATPDIPLPSPKLATKKPRRKPQVRASPTQKPVKPSRKAIKKELPRTPKSEKLKKPINPVPLPVKVKQEVRSENPVNHLTFEKPFMSEKVPQRSVRYLANGNLKMEPLPSPKNDINVFANSDFKEPEIFDSRDIDESLENEDLNMPEDLGDISPTGMLRDSVLKLPLEIPEPGGNSRHKPPRKSPIDSFSIISVNEGNLHKPIVVTNNRVEPARKTNLPAENKHYEIPARVNHMNNILPGIRPSRSSVITLPKYPSNSTSLGATLTRHDMVASSAEFTSFTPIGPNIVKSEAVVRKPEPRAIDLNHGPPLFPLSFDAVLNSTVSWGGAGKLVLNSRARPLLLNPQMNPATFSPPSISPHISPQISLGTAFSFDRPSVLQHSNSPSPTLPFNPNLPNSPHGKLTPRILRVESRGSVNSASDIDPFFGASFDKP